MKFLQLPHFNCCLLIKLKYINLNVDRSPFFLPKLSIRYLFAGLLITCRITGGFIIRRTAGISGIRRTAGISGIRWTDGISGILRLQGVAQFLSPEYLLVHVVQFGSAAPTLPKNQIMYCIVNKKKLWMILTKENCKSNLLSSSYVED